MLPKIPKAFNKRAMQTIRFGGINLTESAGDGELRDSRNMTSAFYPTLTQRKARVAVEGYANPTDMYEWDGKLIVVDNGTLYVDGDEIKNVLPGKKQWAVVNTKLVVFPDKIYVDLENNEYKSLDSEVLLDSSVTITDHTISSSTGTGEGYQSGITYVSWWTGETAPTINTYPEADIASAYSDGEWDFTGLTATVKSPFVDTKLAAGDVFVPSLDNAVFAPVFVGSSNYNTEGYYAKVTKVECATGKTTGQYYLRSTPSTSGSIVKTIPNNTTIEVYGLDSSGWWAYTKYDGSYGWVAKTGLADYSNIAYGVTITFDVMLVVPGEGELFSSKFAESQRLSLSGSSYGIMDNDDAVIASIDDATNTMTFAVGTFTVPTLTYSGTLAAGQYYFEDSGSYYSFELEDAYDGILFLADGKVFMWEDGEATELTTGSTQTGTELTGTAYDTTCTIRKYIPDLDYICSSNNRLVGVSNEERTIHFSSLGDPSDFYSHPDTADGAYSVAVGSEGKFTGIIDYGGNVLAWKEFRLHKVLGTDPSTYYIHDSTIMGVQEGSYRSMKIVNNVLYYKGPYGVYAYGGNTPTLISYNLGNDMYYDAVADSDGRGYYIAMKQGGVSKLYVYDLTHGTWMIEDEIPVDAMATVNGTLHFLSNGSIYKTWQDADETISWMVEFAPTVETIRTSRTSSTLMFQKKGYTKVILALDMAEGSHVTVSTKQDNDIWRTAWNKDADRFLTYSVPLMLGRCQRFALKIEGQGKVMIRGIQREAVIGSEVPN